MESTLQKPTWNRKTVLRYVALQLPGIVLVSTILWGMHAVFGISERMVWALLLFWIVKDTLLFFFVWPAYQVIEGDGWYSLNGLRGEVRKPLQPEGVIRIRGVLWKARVEDELAVIPAGTQVEIVGREGIRLIVRSRPEQSK